MKKRNVRKVFFEMALQVTMVIIESQKGYLLIIIISVTSVDSNLMEKSTNLINNIHCKKLTCQLRKEQGLI